MADNRPRNLERANYSRLPAEKPKPYIRPGALIQRPRAGGGQEARPGPKANRRGYFQQPAGGRGEPDNRFPGLGRQDWLQGPGQGALTWRKGRPERNPKKPLAAGPDSFEARLPQTGAASKGAARPILAIQPLPVLQTGAASKGAARPDWFMAA